jgi:hypothetical protein
VWRVSGPRNGIIFLSSKTKVCNYCISGVCDSWRVRRAAALPRVKRDILPSTPNHRLSVTRLHGGSDEFDACQLQLQQSGQAEQALFYVES